MKTSPYLVLIFLKILVLLLLFSGLTTSQSQQQHQQPTRNSQQKQQLSRSLANNVKLRQSRSRSPFLHHRLLSGAVTPFLNAAGQRRPKPPQSPQQQLQPLLQRPGQPTPGVREGQNGAAGPGQGDNRGPRRLQQQPQSQSPPPWLQQTQRPSRRPSSPPALIGGGSFTPRPEVFFVKLEDGFFGCQVNESVDVLQLFEISKLCDGTPQCWQGSDESSLDLKCSRK